MYKPKRNKKQEYAKSLPKKEKYTKPPKIVKKLFKGQTYAWI